MGWLVSPLVGCGLSPGTKRTNPPKSELLLRRPYFDDLLDFSALYFAVGAIGISGSVRLDALRFGGSSWGFWFWKNAALLASIRRIVSSTLWSKAKVGGVGVGFSSSVSVREDEVNSSSDVLGMWVEASLLLSDTMGDVASTSAG